MNNELERERESHFGRSRLIALSVIVASLAQSVRASPTESVSGWPSQILEIDERKHGPTEQLSRWLAEPAVEGEAGEGRLARQWFSPFTTVVPRHRHRLAHTNLPPPASPLSPSPSARAHGFAIVGFSPLATAVAFASRAHSSTFTVTGEELGDSYGRKRTKGRGGRRSND